MHDGDFVSVILNPPYYCGVGDIKRGQKSPTGYDLTGVQQSGGRREKQRLGDDFKIKGSLLFSDSSELTKPYKDSK